MKLFYRDKKLQKVCGSARNMEAAFGKAMAMKLQRRLDELTAAESLADMSHLPPARCHELSGNRNGQFSIDLAHPFRLIIEPTMAPPPLTPDGGIDRARIHEIIVREVVDTH